jgi:4'-phosphopantetheinyl transferase
VSGSSRRYLDKKPHDVSCYNQYGKPALLSADNKETICFNLSHSHELVQIAVTQNHDIGVDLEYIRPDVPWEMLASEE